MEGIKIITPKYRISMIVCDLGNVLIDVKNVRAGLDVSKYGRFKRSAIISKINKYEKGEISTEEFYTWFAKKTKQEINVKKLDKLFEKVFSLNEDMSYLLKDLRSKYRLVALSNTNEANFEYIRKKYDVVNIFDDYVLSYRVGALKPDKKMYKAALDKVYKRPDNCVYIDDNENFLKAAKKFGFNTVHYKDYPDLEERLKEFGVRLPLKHRVPKD